MPGVDVMSGMPAMADVMSSVPMSSVPMSAVTVSTAMPAMRESTDGHDAPSHGACRQ